MGKSSISVYRGKKAYYLYVNDRIAVTSPYEIREAGTGSSNYLVYDVHGDFRIYNTKRGAYVSSRTFIDICEYSDISKSFAGKLRLESNQGIFYPYLLILDSGYIFEVKGPEFFKEIRPEVGSIRAVQTFNIEDNKCNWLYLYVDTNKAEFLWKNKSAQRIPLGDLISFQQNNFHIFYSTIADVSFLNKDDSSEDKGDTWEPRKFLYFFKYKSRSKAYDNEIAKIIDKRASFNTFSICKEAPMYFIGEQKQNKGSRYRLFRFNYTDYKEGSEVIKRKKYVPTKQMLLPLTDYEYYEAIEYKASYDVFVVCQDNRWFLLKYDTKNIDFARPLKSISYPSNTFVWINGLMLAIRDDGFYDIYSISDDKYTRISLLWRNITYNNNLESIRYIDLTGHEQSLSISYLLEKYTDYAQQSSHKLISPQKQQEENINEINNEDNVTHYYVDYCTVGNINYNPSDSYLVCDKSTNT